MDYRTLERLSLPALFSPPEAIAPRAIVASATVLTGLLVVGVPVLALGTGVPTLAAVALAGAAYGAFILAAGRFIEGTFAAVFVLATFNANLPLPILGVPRGGNAGVLHPAFMFVDVVALPLAGLFAYWWWTGRDARRPLFNSRLARIAAVAFTGLVVWSFLSALVGNGPSRPAAAFWALFQVRYLLVFVVAAVITRRIGIRSSVYSLLIAVGGQVLVSLAQALHGGGFGLTQLGDYTDGAAVTFALGPVTFKAGMFAGGFAGTVRVFVAIVLLCIPILVVLVMDGDVAQRTLAAFGLVGFVLTLRIARSDAGLGAIVVALALLALALAVSVVRDVHHSRTDYALGGGTLLGTGVLTVLLYRLRDTGTVQTVSDAAPTATAKAVDTAPLVSGSYLTTRFEQWMAALDVASRHPLFGLGGFNFTLISDSSYGLAHAQVIDSVYFAYLAAVGVVGEMLFLIVLLAVFAITARAALTRVALTDRPLWIGLACGMVAFHAFAFWTAMQNGSVSYLVLFVLAGVVVGASGREITLPAGT